MQFSCMYLLCINHKSATLYLNTNICLYISFKKITLSMLWSVYLYWYMGHYNKRVKFTTRMSVHHFKAQLVLSIFIRPCLFISLPNHEFEYEGISSASWEPIQDQEKVKCTTVHCIFIKMPDYFLLFWTFFRVLV